MKRLLFALVFVGLLASVSEAKDFTLSWNRCAGATEYRITTWSFTVSGNTFTRAANPTVSPAIPDPTTGTLVSYTKTVADTAFEMVQISACNSVGCTPRPDVVYFFAPSWALPVSPTNVLVQ